MQPMTLSPPPQTKMKCFGRCCKTTRPTTQRRRMRLPSSMQNTIRARPMELLLCLLSIVHILVDASSTLWMWRGSSRLSSWFASAQQFNYEVEKRVLERLNDFLGDPIATTRLIDSFRRNGGFPNDLAAPDRDLYLALAYSSFQQLVYYGLEDGSISGYYVSNAYYREPGSAGYSKDDPDKAHIYNSCFDNATGEPRPCRLQPGDDYISCDGNEPEDTATGLCPKLELCPGQPVCADDEFVTIEELRCCRSSQKWCRQYSIVSAPNDVEDTGMGFVPLFNHCIDRTGQFSEEPNAVIDPLSPNRYDPNVNLVTCTYDNLGVTPVRRENLEGPFAYCGGGGAICQGTLRGGYANYEYDPRYRPWYIETKKKQRAMWQPPYPFFSLGIGVTYSTPIYSVDEQGRQVFVGVLSVDYQFENIVQFLVDNYGNTTTSVFIYEEAEPHYVIGSSTGSKAARNFLTEDLTVPCPVDRGDEIPCTPVRTKMADLSGHPMDPVLVAAYRKHLAEGYPRDVLSVTVAREVTDSVFVSQSTVFEQSGADLRWRIIVVSPGANSDSDAIVGGTDFLVPLCLTATVGFVVCLVFLSLLIQKRAQKAIVFADWRFTCAFVFGCVLLNISSFTLLGENTDELCLMRMWTFHLFFVVALAPVFVKVWRIKQLVSNDLAFRRQTITNVQAATYTMPMIIGQVIILLFFTFYDPPVETHFIENVDGILTQRMVCQSDTDAFFITVSIYEAAFVLSGCILAYMTKDLNDDFGEAKQLIFAMYNIALVGIITVLVVRMGDLSDNAQKMMQSVGVLWGTIFSTAAFVVPRMIQLRQSSRSSQSGTVHVTGMGRKQNYSEAIRYEADRRRRNSFGADVVSELTGGKDIGYAADAVEDCCGEHAAGTADCGSCTNDGNDEGSPGGETRIMDMDGDSNEGTPDSLERTARLSEHGCGGSGGNGRSDARETKPIGSECRQVRVDWTGETRKSSEPETG